MAPWNNATAQPERGQQQQHRMESEEDNPFIAFRKFADEQFNNLVHGLNALPSMLSEARSKAEEEQKRWRQELQDGSKSVEREARHLWEELGFTGETPSPPTVSGDMEAGRDAARTLLLQARNANVGVNPTRMQVLYRDMEPTLLHSGSNKRGQAYGLFKNDAQWLSVDWFKSSPYSPTQMETHRHLHQQGSMWRAAFEDLLSAELDKEQGAWAAWTNKVNDQKLYSSWAQGPADWMLGLQCRGVLPPQLPQLYNMPPSNTHAMDRAFSNLVQGRSPTTVQEAMVTHDFERLAKEIITFDADEIAEQLRLNNPTTELDIYESFLGKANRDAPSAAGDYPSVVSAHVREHQQPAQTLSKTEVQPSHSPESTKPSVMSTLSTTERTTLPDGTEITKVVLKKRFTDGREESTETVATTHGQNQRPNVQPVEAQVARTEEPKSKQENKGWFWN